MATSDYKTISIIGRQNFAKLEEHDLKVVELVEWEEMQLKASAIEAMERYRIWPELADSGLFWAINWMALHLEETQLDRILDIQAQSPSEAIMRAVKVIEGK